MNTVHNLKTFIVMPPLLDSTVSTVLMLGTVKKFGMPPPKLCGILIPTMMITSMPLMTSLMMNSK